MDLVKSKQRVADHGEVFTPPGWSRRCSTWSRPRPSASTPAFLEPACGSGNFLVPVLRRKLATVEARYGKSDFERAPPRPAGAHVHLRHRAARRQRRRVPGEPARSLRRRSSASTAGDDVRDGGRVVLASTSSMATRSRCRRSTATASRSPSPSGPTSARASSTAATSASTPSPRCRRSARGHPLRRPRQARDLHPDQDHGRSRSPTSPGAGAAMTRASPFSLRNRNPDVLTCIANLSNDEVFTPPEFANQMLDTRRRGLGGRPRRSEHLGRPDRARSSTRSPSQASSSARSPGGSSTGLKTRSRPGDASTTS